MPRAKNRALRDALVAQAWDGFKTAGEIAAQLERWSVATVSDRLWTLTREGLLWSVLEAGEEPTHKFAHVRADTGTMMIRRSAA